MPAPPLDYRRLADLCREAELALAQHPQRSVSHLRRDLAHAATALHAVAAGQDAVTDVAEGQRDRYGPNPNGESGAA